MNRIDFLEKIRNFYGGKLYPVLVALLIFLGHSFELELAFGVLMFLTVIIGCLFCNDLRFAITPFMCTIFIVAINHSPNVPNYSRYYLEPHVLTVIIVTAVLVLASFLYFAIRNRHAMTSIPKRSMFWSMAILCFVISFNGILNKGYTLYNFFYVTSFYLSLLLVYWFFAAYINFDSRKIYDYFMYCLVVTGLLICSELMYAYFTTMRFDEAGKIIKESVLLGWGVWTAIGGMIAMLMPACFYFAASHRFGWIGFFLGFFMYFCILVSQARGALLFGSVSLLLCLITLFFFGKQRKRNRVLIIAILILGVAGGIFLREKILSLISNFLANGFGDNGRFELWEIGWKHFTEYPIFGSGFYDSFINEEWLKDVYPYLYHNTVIQFLAACGVLGLCAYLFHRISTLVLVLRRPSLYKTFMGIGIFGLLAVSLLDVLFFNTYPTIIYSLMLLFMDKQDGELLRAQQI